VSSIPTPVDKSKSNGFLQTVQDTMVNRLANAYGGSEPIVYEFTDDKALLHQYFILRRAMYERVHGIDASSMGEDLYDKISHVLIARRGKLCLGGVRLTVREPDEHWNLPMESADFNLRSAFPNLPFGKVQVGEVSRFAVMEDSGADNTVMYNLCKVMFDKVLALEVPYFFAKAPYTLARNWRMIARSVGVKTARICNEVALPESFNAHDMQFHLMMFDFVKLAELNDAAALASGYIAASHMLNCSAYQPVATAG
jgi:hypothetical protein